MLSLTLLLSARYAAIFEFEGNVGALVPLFGVHKFNVECAVVFPKSATVHRGAGRVHISYFRPLHDGLQGDSKSPIYGIISLIIS